MDDLKSQPQLSIEAELPGGYRESELGPLPDHWKVVRLSDITLRAKQTDPKKNPDVTFKYVDVSSVSSKNLAIENYAEHDGRSAPSRARKLIRTGDIIFATVRPYLKRLAMVPPELDGQLCSTAFCPIRAEPDIVDPSFLFFACSTDSFIHRVSEHQSGSSYPAVTDKDVLNEPIVYPPLPEQQAIAHILRTVQKAIETTEQVIAATRELKRSLMNHLFTYGPVPVDEAEQVPLKETEIGPMPEHWEFQKLRDIAETSSGGTPKRDNPDYYGGSISWVKSGELNDSVVSRTSETITEEGLAKSSAKVFPSGTLLVAMYGATAGKVGILGDEAATNQAVCAIFPSVSTLPEYLFYVLIFKRSELLGERYGGAQPNLSQTVLRNFTLPLPPTTEQEQIACTLAAVDSKLEVEENRRASLEVLFKTLLHNLMTGKVRVNDLDLSEVEEMV